MLNVPKLGMLTLPDFDGEPPVFSPDIVSPVALTPLGALLTDDQIEAIFNFPTPDHVIGIRKFDTVHDSFVADLLLLRRLLALALQDRRGSTRARQTHGTDEAKSSKAIIGRTVVREHRVVLSIAAVSFSTGFMATGQHICMQM